MDDVNKAIAFTQKEIEAEALEIYKVSHELFMGGRRHHVAHLWKLLDELSNVRRKMVKLLPEDAQR